MEDRTFQSSKISSGWIMYKGVLFIILVVFCLGTGCQNGHKSQSWAPKQHKAPGRK
jgi:hypothetical protein